MTNISFIGNSLKPDQSLELFRKMTPNRSGRWGNLVGVDSHNKADYHIVIDKLTADHGTLSKEWIISAEPTGTVLKKLIESEVVRDVSDTQIALNYNLLEKESLVKDICGFVFKRVWGNLTDANKQILIDERKCVFLGAHPKSIESAHINMDSLKCFKKYDCEKEFGFGEWWVGYDYDFLSSLKPYNKDKKLGCIVSNVDTLYNHKARRAWLQRFTDKQPFQFNLYGRIEPFTEKMAYYYRGRLGTASNHMLGKEEVLASHQYMVEFDNDAPNGHYFSERIFDDLLLWAMPIYWGGGNLHKYIPSKSFRYLDINDNGDSVFKVLQENPYDESLEAIAEARNILLNQLQVWPRAHKAIFGVCK